jgi:GNAT superfamily N-acetyltransferase
VEAHVPAYVGWVEIRPASVDDIPRMQAIEIEAGQAFIDVGRPEIAADEPISVDELQAYVELGRCWVTGEPAAAYIVVDVLDGVVHIEQVSVHPDAAGQGLGAQLMDHVQNQGHERVTLTTFADVPWNAPYYARLGFAVLTEDDIGPELGQRVDEEHAHGLHRDERVTMGRTINPRR